MALAGDLAERAAVNEWRNERHMPPQKNGAMRGIVPSQELRGRAEREFRLAIPPQAHLAQSFADSFLSYLSMKYSGSPKPADFDRELSSSAGALRQMSGMTTGFYNEWLLTTLANPSIAPAFFRSPQDFVEICSMDHEWAAGAIDGLRSNQRTLDLLLNSAGVVTDTLRSLSGDVKTQILFSSLAWDNSFRDRFMDYIDHKISKENLIVAVYSMCNASASSLGDPIDYLHEDAAGRSAYVRSLSAAQVVSLLCSDPDLFYTTSNAMLFDRLVADFPGQDRLGRLISEYELTDRQVQNLVFRTVRYDRFTGSRNSVFGTEDVPRALDVMLLGVRSGAYDPNYFYLLANAVERVPSYGAAASSLVEDALKQRMSELEQSGQASGELYNALVYTRHLIDPSSQGSRTMAQAQERGTFRLSDYAAGGKAQVLQVYDPEDIGAQAFSEEKARFSKYGRPHTGRNGEAICENGSARIVLFRGRGREENQQFVQNWLASNRNGIITYRGHSYHLADNLPFEIFGNREGRYLFIPGSCGSAGRVPDYIAKNPNTDLRFISNAQTGLGWVTNNIVDVLLSQRTPSRLTDLIERNSQRINGGNEKINIKAYSRGEELLYYAGFGTTPRPAAATPQAPTPISAPITSTETNSAIWRARALSVQFLPSNVASPALPGVLGQLSGYFSSLGTGEWLPTSSLLTPDGSFALCKTPAQYSQWANGWADASREASRPPVVITLPKAPAPTDTGRVVAPKQVVKPTPQTTRPAPQLTEPEVAVMLVREAYSRLLKDPHDPQALSWLEESSHVFSGLEKGAWLPASYMPSALRTPSQYLDWCNARLADAGRQPSAQPTVPYGPPVPAYTEPATRLEPKAKAPPPATERARAPYPPPEMLFETAVQDKTRVAARIPKIIAEQGMLPQTAETAPEPVSPKRVQKETVAPKETPISIFPEGGQPAPARRAPYPPPEMLFEPAKQDSTKVAIRVPKFIREPKETVTAPSGAVREPAEVVQTPPARVTRETAEVPSRALQPPANVPQERAEVPKPGAVPPSPSRAPVSRVRAPAAIKLGPRMQQAVTSAMPELQKTGVSESTAKALANEVAVRSGTEFGTLSTEASRQAVAFLKKRELLSKDYDSATATQDELLLVNQAAAILYVKGYPIGSRLLDDTFKAAGGVQDTHAAALALETSIPPSSAGRTATSRKWFFSLLSQVRESTRQAAEEKGGPE